MNEPIATGINNNQPGWTNIIETAPNVTLEVGTRLYLAPSPMTDDVAGIVKKLVPLLAMLEPHATSPGVPNWARQLMQWCDDALALIERLSEQLVELDADRDVEIEHSVAWRKRATNAESQLAERDAEIAKLKAAHAAEANDGTTPETDAAAERGSDHGLGNAMMSGIWPLARRLERERNWLAARVAGLEREVNIAAGMLSTTDGYSDKHPQVALDAIREAARSKP